MNIDRAQPPFCLTSRGFYNIAPPSARGWHKGQMAHYVAATELIWWQKQSYQVSVFIKMIDDWKEAERKNELAEKVGLK